MEIIKSCKRGDDEIKANLAVSRALFDFVRGGSLSSREREFPRSIDLGPAQGIGGWRTWTVHGADALFVPFIDYRKKNGLTRQGMKFVFSAMHHGFRSLNPDYADIKLAIVQLPEVKGKRTPSLIFDEGFELYSYDQLSDMVSDLYRVWFEILRERDLRERASSEGRRGSLL